jgi:Cytidylate kinase-like family
VPHGIVCVSRTAGAGAEEISRLVAERLGCPLIDDEIVLRAADSAGVESDLVTDVERGKSFLGHLVDELLETGALSAYGPVVPRPEGPSREQLREFIRNAIAESATAEQVVIVAHGAGIALSDRDDVLRIFITGSRQDRSRRLAAAEQLDDGEAGKLVERSDAARADYLKRFYDVRTEEPTNYDLVLNTDRLSPADAAALIVDAARR